MKYIWGSCMSKRKGLAMLMFILIIMLAILGFLLVLRATGVVNIITIKKTIFVSTEIDDKGTELFSFLEATGDGPLNNMGTLSLVETTEVPKDMRETLELLHGRNYHISVTRPYGSLEYGPESPDNSQKVISDIALPGAQRNALRGQIELDFW